MSLKSALLICLTLWSLSTNALEFVTNRALVGADDPIEVALRFNQDDSGDLYMAVLISGKLFFYGEDNQFHEQPLPLRRDSLYSGEMGLFFFPPGVVPPHPYFLYAVVTDAGAGVFDISRWHGGWDGLAKELVQVGETFFGPGDLDDDGFYDDDLNRDGFHDDDLNYDGWHDSHGDSARGQALYVQYCASCHGQTPDARRRGKSAEAIAGAIAQNKGGMGALANVLTSADLQDIAAYLAQ